MVLNKEEKKIRHGISCKKCIKNNPEKYNTEYWVTALKKTHKKYPEKYNNEYFNENNKKAHKNNPNKYNSKYFINNTRLCEKNNPEKYNSGYFTECCKKTRKNNPEKYGKNSIYYIKCLCRNRFYLGMQLYSKTGKVMSSKQYGINWGKISKHLWNNRPQDFEKWNKNNPDNVYSIDHIKPLSKFNYDNLSEIKKSWAISNLKWMKLKDNIRKGNKLLMAKIQ